LIAFAWIAAVPLVYPGGTGPTVLGEWDNIDGNHRLLLELAPDLGVIILGRNGLGGDCSRFGVGRRIERHGHEGCCGVGWH